MIPLTKVSKMNITILFLWIFILNGGISATALEASKKCKTAKELNNLCGEHTYESVSPILKYVDQLQKKTEEINNSREKEQQLKIKETEVELKDELIESKEKHIQDLQSVKAEVLELKTFIREELDRKLSQIVSNTSEMLLKINTIIARNDAQLKSKDEALGTCQSSLSEYKLQTLIQNKTIAENTSTISQLKAELDQTKLKEQKNHDICIFNNIYKVKLPNFEPFLALCNSDISGTGWTVIQQRINGKENFKRNWEDYKNGFGNFTGDFFLGLEKIHRLTKHTPYELYIHMEPFGGGYYNGDSFYARYNNFSIAGEDDKYRLLSLGSYSGNKENNRMKDNELQQFSTIDSDNDALKDTNCAKILCGGWWYGKCNSCNPNGKYYGREHNHEPSNWWHACYSLKTIKMMIRPRGIGS